MALIGWVAGSLENERDLHPSTLLSFQSSFHPSYVDFGTGFIVKPENTCTLSKTQNPTLLARFPNLAALQSVNLIMGFTIMRNR